METKTGNALKQALEKRKSGSLSSNFTFRMMEQIRVEKAKQERREKRNLLLALLASLLAMLAVLVYYLFFYLDIRVSHLLPRWEFTSASFALTGFYVYIALLVLVLLGVDYRVRKKINHDMTRKLENTTTFACRKRMG